MSTLVLQSHRSPLPQPWLHPCLESVRTWAGNRGYDYRFLGDEIFAPLSREIRRKTANRLSTASDLARLHALRQALDEGYETAIWCDADFLVFDPAAMELPGSSYGLGREVWVQPHGDRWRAYVKVHNAFLFFRRQNPFLDFYLDAAKNMLQAHQGAMVPQLVGPKFLTAIHNIISCPVVESTAMLSPHTSRDILAGGGPALELFLERSAVKPAGVNLCASLLPGHELAPARVSALVQRLLEDGIPGAR